MLRPSATVLVAGAIALAVVACSPLGEAAPSAPTGLGPDHPLIIVDQWAGGPLYAAVDAPRRLTLMADGRLVVQGHDGASIYPTLTQTTLAPDALADVWAGAIRAGLGTQTELPLPGVFDAGMTIIALDDGSKRTALQVYALGSEGADAAVAGIPERDLALRRSIGDYLDALEGRAGSQPYSPPQVALWIGPVGDGSEFRPVVAWTGPVDLATAGQVVNDAFWQRCVVLEGRAAAEVAAIGATLPTQAAVSQDGTTWRIGLRPIMPDEVGRVGCTTVP